MKLFLALVVVLLVTALAAQAQNKYIGVKMCSMCHKTEKQGKQLDIWQKSDHSNAYKTLTTAKSAEIAKAKGITKPAHEAAECLDCHAPAYKVDAKLLDKSFDLKDGVQCEDCHGAGSAFKTIPIMKDKAKAVAAGMRDFKDEAAIKASCVTCHNEKSPTYKPFKFEEAWGKMKHPVPKG